MAQYKFSTSVLRQVFFVKCFPSGVFRQVFSVQCFPSSIFPSSVFRQVLSVKHFPVKCFPSIAFCQAFSVKCFPSSIVLRNIRDFFDGGVFRSIGNFLVRIKDSRHVQLAIYIYIIVFHEESESAVRIYQFLHPGRTLRKNAL